MKYNRIRKMDVSNGPGIRVSIFMQGCVFNCKNCFNPETHSFEEGKDFNDKIINEILDLADKEFIVGLSILGGEPLHPKNIEGTTKLARMFREKFPTKSIWIWSGFLFESYIKDKEVLNYTDIIVDGVYKDELFDPNLKWRGSKNQRVIDVKETLDKNKVVLYKKGVEEYVTTS